MLALGAMGMSRMRRGPWANRDERLSASPPERKSGGLAATGQCEGLPPGNLTIPIVWSGTLKAC